LSYAGLLLTASFGAIPSYHGAMASIADRTNMCGYEIRLSRMLSMRSSLQGSQRVHRRATADADYRINQWIKVVSSKIAVLTIALSAFVAPAAFGKRLSGNRERSSSIMRTRMCSTEAHQSRNGFGIDHSDAKCVRRDP
jgi:hypothetical protein